MLSLIDEELAARGDLPRHYDDYYPEEGPLRRGLYPKQMAFFAGGKAYRERLMLAANRVGKTEGTGLYELVAHCTGRYPPWWAGRQWHRPVRCWAAGDTGKNVREILQRKLLGPLPALGTGLVPKQLIHGYKRGSGVAESVEILYIKHTRGVSEIVFKSYDQRRIAFQGTEQDIILLDEEPPIEIYTECLMRTMTNDGMVMLTFTPLQGLSEVVLDFYEGGNVGMVKPGKFAVNATWDDVPHLTKQAKDDLWAKIPPCYRDARSRGIPHLGSGVIYPVPEEDFVVKRFEIPKFWPRAYGMDVGWNKTAAVWGALDRESGIRYLYRTHYRSQAEPAVHAAAIRAHGSWIHGVIDPGARGRAQSDGTALMESYNELGLRLSMADNGVESGLYDTWELLSEGRLKVFTDLNDWLNERRVYRRDEKGRVVKENDHLMDATRYYVKSGRDVEKVEPVKKERELVYGQVGGWMQ